MTETNRPERLELTIDRRRALSTRNVIPPFVALAGVTFVSIPVIALCVVALYAHPNPKGEAYAIIGLLLSVGFYVYVFSMAVGRALLLPRSTLRIDASGYSYVGYFAVSSWFGARPTIVHVPWSNVAGFQIVDSHSIPGTSDAHVQIVGVSLVDQEAFLRSLPANRQARWRRLLDAVGKLNIAPVSGMTAEALRATLEAYRSRANGDGTAGKEIVRMHDTTSTS
jgi:hypothetical protein